MKSFFERPITTLLLTAFFTLVSFSLPYSGLLASAEAQEKKVVKKTIKKKLAFKKVVKKNGGGNNGISKQIRELKAQISGIQTQIDNLEGGFEGPQGEQGDQVPV